jgi:hypothetical protein
MSSHVLASAWLDGELAGALDQAARDARTTRADYIRRIILESVRQTGHLPALQTPRRHRVRRAAA